ncbi:MAG TPA: endonuclease/exonuclease/phosphatase family protein [Tepidisphaeraceae bacterium]|jgi:endonuclease/exonuclease/phosphatase family metal-dependent hydrolase|nr:endonuclease/exonuclease/phosphatase family protein [Tepidisphaeraceae bacterium]
MRLLSYNILDGGEGRADPLAEVMIAQRADIVAVVEADDVAVQERIGKRLKMDYVVGESAKHSAACYSRWRIAESINHSALHPDLKGSYLEVKVLEPAGRTWEIGVVHMPAHALEENETQRERELATLLKIFASHRRERRPHLLVGDFNSNSPIQNIDPTKCKQSTREEWKANGGHIPRRVVQSILDAGYIDTLAAFDLDQAANRGSFSTQFPGQRVDYIFAFGFDKSQVRSAWCEQDRLAKYASDHFPVGVEIE